MYDMVESIVGKEIVIIYAFIVECPGTKMATMHKGCKMLYKTSAQQ